MVDRVLLTTAPPLRFLRRNPEAGLQRLQAVGGRRAARAPNPCRKAGRRGRIHFYPGWISGTAHGKDPHPRSVSAAEAAASRLRQRVYDVASPCWISWSPSAPATTALSRCTAPRWGRSRPCTGLLASTTRRKRSTPCCGLRRVPRCVQPDRPLFCLRTVFAYKSLLTFLSRETFIFRMDISRVRSAAKRPLSRASSTA